MFRSFMRTLDQMNDGPFVRVLIISVGTTLLLMAALLFVGLWAAQFIPEFGWNWVNRAIGWIGHLALDDSTY